MRPKALGTDTAQFFIALKSYVITLQRYMCKKKKGERHKVKSSEIMTVRFHSTDWLKKISTSAKFKRWPDYKVKVISLSAATATQFKVLRYIICARVTNLHLSYMRTALCTSKSEMINFLYILLAFKPSKISKILFKPFSWCEVPWFVMFASGNSSSHTRP